MTPILTFTRGELNRELVTLGAVRIGEVSPLNVGRHLAAYALWLPDVSHAPRPAESMLLARSAVEQAVNNWLLRIGVFYPGQAVELRIPEDDEETAQLIDLCKKRASA